ncbi:MAG TPA: FAD-dependent oxidoreductase [Streptosporangiaceae bacterium]
MTAEHEYAVVGAGLLGLAAGRALARRGRDVTVLDQGEIGNETAGSKGSCRIFRLGYPDPCYVTLAQRSRVLWHQLEAESGRPLLHPVPQLTFGRDLTAVHDGMRAAGAPCELLSAAEAADRFPGIRVHGQVLLETQSGVLAADQALLALADGLPEIRTGVRVTGIADDGRRVRLQTSAGPLQARKVIVCAGPFTSALVSGQLPAVPSAPTLEQVGYLSPVAGPVTTPPIFVCHDGRTPYGLPVPGSALYKIGVHRGGPPADLLRLTAGPEAGLLAELVQLAGRYLPGYHSEPASTERCVYDNTQDEDFVVDSAGNVVAGCGTSGHGFKFGPLLGEWLASLAEGTEPAGLPAARFAVARFGPAPARA